jgi:peroxiredoxin
LRDGGSPRSSAGLAIGDPAPALALPDLSGQTVDLADFRGLTVG